MSVVTCTKPGFFSFWFSSHLKRFYSHLTRKTNREREMFYLTTHSTHFIYGYVASDIWLRTILIVRKETHCCHIGYSYRLTARVLLYASSHRQDNTYHSLCYTSRGALPHDWCNKGCGMCYPVCGMMHIKEPLLLIGKSSPCGGSGFPLSLSEWSFTISLTPYNRK